MSEDEEEGKRLYERHRDDLSKREISNAENLDKSILTYSGAGLALSLGFLKDFIPIAEAKAAWALYGSWIGFTLAMVLVVVSYVLSLKAIQIQLDRAKRYYLLGEMAAFTEKKTGLEVCADHVNGWMSAIAFCVALVLTIFFVSLNLSEANVANPKIVHGIAQDGLTSMEMQQLKAASSVTAERGLTGATMQPVKPAAAPTQQPAPAPATPAKPK
jgi:hypothetical protein